MEGSLFKTLSHVHIEPVSSELPATPRPALSRKGKEPAVPHRGSGSIELRDLTSPPVAAAAAASVSVSVPGASTDPPRGPFTPTTPASDAWDLENSAPGSPAEPADAFEAQPSLFDPPMNKYRLASCCLMNLVAGFTDSAPGALIPYMET